MIVFIALSHSGMSFKQNNQYLIFQACRSAPALHLSGFKIAERLSNSHHQPRPLALSDRKMRRGQSLCCFFLSGVLNQLFKNIPFDWKHVQCNPKHEP